MTGNYKVPYFDATNFPLTGDFTEDVTYCGSENVWEERRTVAGQERERLEREGHVE